MFVKDLLVGIFEGGLEIVTELVEASGPRGLLSTASLGSPVLKGGSAGLGADIDSLSLGVSEALAGRVESLHQGSVLQRVLLALGGNVSVDALHAKLALDLVRVDDSGEVGARHHASSESESSLQDGLRLTVSAIDIVESVHAVLGEDDESAEVTTRGELEEVKSVHAASVNTGEVPGGLLHVQISITVDDQRSLTEGETGVSVLALTGAQLLGGADALQVTIDTELFQSLKEISSLVRGEAIHDERKFRDIANVVTSGHDERTASSGGEGGGNSVSLLVGVNLSVPLSPELERSEHATLAAHVAEGTLTGAVSTRARDSWDSSDGTTGTPGLGRVLVASVPVDGATLASVLAHVGVAELDEIVSDGSREDGGHVNGSGHGTILSRVCTDGRTRSHTVYCTKVQ